MSARSGDTITYKGVHGFVYKIYRYPNEDGEEETRLLTRFVDGTIASIEPYDDDLEITTPKVFVNVYLHDRAYGGPEEGGWWYDYYEPVGDMCMRFPTEKEAEAYLEKVEAETEEENADRRSDISSVLSEGRYEVRLEAWPAEHSPKTRPYYE